MTRESPRPGRVGAIALFLAALLLCFTCAKERAGHAPLASRAVGSASAGRGQILLPKLTPPTGVMPVHAMSHPPMRAFVDASVAGDDNDASVEYTGDDPDAGPRRRGMRTLITPRIRRMRFVMFHPLRGLGGGGGSIGPSGGGGASPPRRPAPPFRRGGMGQAAALSGPAPVVHAPQGGGGPTTVSIGGANAPAVPGVGVAASAPRPHAAPRMGPARRGRALTGSLPRASGRGPTEQEREDPTEDDEANTSRQNESDSPDEHASVSEHTASANAHTASTTPRSRPAASWRARPAAAPRPRPVQPPSRMPPPRFARTSTPRH